MQQTLSNLEIAIRTVEAKGILTKQESIQLMQGGIPVLHLLADSLNIPLTQVITMMEEGKITSEMVQNALSTSEANDFFMLKNS